MWSEYWLPDKKWFPNSIRLNERERERDGEKEKVLQKRELGKQSTSECNRDSIGNNKKEKLLEEEKERKISFDRERENGWR